MDPRSRLKKSSALSFSMPDVTGAGFSPSLHSPLTPTQEIPVMEEEEEREEYGGVEAVKEDHWVESTDPNSGAVFYVDSAPWMHTQRNGSLLPPSTSSSSLSSTASTQHPPLPTPTPSPLPQHKHMQSSLLSTSLPPTPQEPHFPPFPRSTTPQLPSSRSRSASEVVHSPQPSPIPSEGRRGPDSVVPEDILESPTADEGWIPKSHSLRSVGSVGRSVRKRWKRMVKGGGRRKSSTPDLCLGLVPSGSFPDLNSEIAYYSRERVVSLGSQPSPPPPSLPHGALYGSRGFPLPSDSSGGIVSVRIFLRSSAHHSRHRHWNLEKLGIVPARSLGNSRYASFSNLRLSFKTHYPPSENALVIRGIIPGSLADLTSQLHPGDTVLAINGHSVNLVNADSVVRSFSDELVLIVKKNYLHSSTLTSTPSHHHLHTSSQRSGLVKLVSGGPSKSHSTHHPSPPPHLLLYVTLETEEDDPADKDMMYWYPKDAKVAVEKRREEEGGGGGGVGGGGRDGVRNLLVQLRGVFLTLSDVMASITMATKSCSTISVSGEVFHLAHIQFSKELLLLALPAKLFPQHVVQKTVEGIERVLCLLYGTPHSAFSSSESHTTVDHLLNLLFHRLFPSSHSHHHHLPSPFTSLAVTRYHLSNDLTVRVGEALDRLEAVSPAHHTDIAYLPKTYYPRGSCLFYRGHLVQSHLSAADFRDVVTFCESYRLLDLTSHNTATTIVIWRELHLSEPAAAYATPSGRSFLLLVGLHHVLIGLLMDGCGLSQEATPTVDPVYVDEARQLITELKAQDVFSNFDGRGSLSTPVPAVTSLDKILATHLSSLHPSQPTRHVRRRSLQQQPQLPVSASDSDDAVELPSHAHQGSLSLPSFRPRAKRKEPLSSQNSLQGALASIAIRQNYMLTAGVENILLSYLSLDVGRGVVLSPTHWATPTGTMHSELLSCFQQTCAAVRDVLVGGVERVREEEEESEEEFDWGSEEEEGEEQGEKPPPPPFSLPAAGGVCVEHGVLLEVPLKNFVPEKQLKTTPPLCYWVVGRLFPDTGQELYVCYQENTSQNVIELAFRLLFASNS